MMRLRCGKFAAQRRRAERVFADEQAVRGDAVRQLEVALRIDAVEPGADHRDGASPAPRLERALVRRAVDAERQARDDGEAARRSDGAAKARAFSSALRRRVAAADDGQRRRAEQRRRRPAAYSSSGGSAVSSSSGG